MKTLYEIIKSLQTTQGTKAKQAILDENKDNALLKAYFKAMLDPAICYYQTKLPKVSCSGSVEFHNIILFDLDRLASREFTGKQAQKFLKEVVESATPECQELIGYIIKRKIADANVGETMVLKTWPGLFFIPPYMRCKSMSKDIKAHYAKLDSFYVQIKRDGSFAYLAANEAITRQGSLYPQWFVNHVCEYIPQDYYLVGEMEVYLNGKLLDRKTGNGVLNSVLQSDSAEEFKQYEFHYVAWDALTENDFEVGYSSTPLEDRIKNLKSLLESLPERISFVEHWEVHSVAEANEIHLRLTKEGKEGTVWKTKDGAWKDTDSGMIDQVKNKVVFEAEYKIKGYYEGEGKAAGMLGGIEVATADDKLDSNCGTGFSDKQRKDLWAIREELPGMIVTLEANDVISAKDRDTLSLSLPVFIEIRKDKNEADTLERVLEQLQAAKEGRI